MTLNAPFFQKDQRREVVSEVGPHWRTRGAASGIKREIKGLKKGFRFGKVPEGKGAKR